MVVFWLKQTKQRNTKSALPQYHHKRELHLENLNFTQDARAGHMSPWWESTHAQGCRLWFSPHAQEVWCTKHVGQCSRHLASVATADWGHGAWMVLGGRKRGFTNRSCRIITSSNSVQPRTFSTCGNGYVKQYWAYRGFLLSESVVFHLDF